jgi:hypothetical protein
MIPQLQTICAVEKRSRADREIRELVDVEIPGQRGNAADRYEHQRGEEPCLETEAALTRGGQSLARIRNLESGAAGDALVTNPERAAHHLHAGPHLALVGTVLLLRIARAVGRRPLPHCRRRDLFMTRTRVSIFRRLETGIPGGAHVLQQGRVPGAQFIG